MRLTQSAGEVGSSTFPLEEMSVSPQTFAGQMVCSSTSFPSVVLSAPCRWVVVRQSSNLTPALN